MRNVQLVIYSYSIGSWCYNSVVIKNNVENIAQKLRPFSFAGLLATVILLFGFQANTILSNSLAIVLITTHQR